MNDFISSKLFTILSLVAVGFLGFAILGGRPEIEELDKEISDLKVQVSEAEQKNENLESDFEFFKSDIYLERQARLKLNLKKPNELVAYIVRNDNVSSHSEEVIEEKGVVEKILDFIFKKRD